MTAFRIPRYLSQLAATPERADLRSWVATLPSVVAEISRRWSLSLGRPFEPGGQCSWVAPARNAKGEDLVLKVGWPHFESEHEAAGLLAWDGRGSVQLCEAERLPNADVLLLERCIPGKPLGHTLPELEQDVIVAGMLRRLWIKPEPGYPFRPLQSMCEAWADDAEQKFEHAERTAHRRMQREGLALFRKLSAPADTDVLLCTDLHGENILAAQRESWLMIDPKPHLGDRAYDPIQHMLNCEERLHNDPLGFIRRMAELLDLDADRVRLWLLARCVQESAGEPSLIEVAYRLE